MQLNSNASDKKQALLKLSFYQPNNISLYSWFFVSPVLQYIFQWHSMHPFSWRLNWSQLWHRLQRNGVMSCITLTHHTNSMLWLAEVRNVTNIIIECVTISCFLSRSRESLCTYHIHSASNIPLSSWCTLKLRIAYSSLNFSEIFVNNACRYRPDKSTQFCLKTGFTVICFIIKSFSAVMPISIVLVTVLWGDNKIKHRWSLEKNG